MKEYYLLKLKVKILLKKINYLCSRFTIQDLTFKM